MLKINKDYKERKVLHSVVRFEDFFFCSTGEEGLDIYEIKDDY